MYRFMMVLVEFERTVEIWHDTYWSSDSNLTPATNLKVEINLRGKMSTEITYLMAFFSADARVR